MIFKSKIFVILKNNSNFNEYLNFKIKILKPCTEHSGIKKYLKFYFFVICIVV